MTLSGKFEPRTQANHEEFCSGVKNETEAALRPRMAAERLVLICPHLSSVSSLFLVLSSLPQRTKISSIHAGLRAIFGVVLSVLSIFCVPAKFG